MAEGAGAPVQTLNAHTICVCVCVCTSCKVARAVKSCASFLLPACDEDAALHLRSLPFNIRHWSVRGSQLWQLDWGVGEGRGGGEVAPFVNAGRPPPHAHVHTLTLTHSSLTQQHQIVFDWQLKTHGKGSEMFETIEFHSCVNVR